MNSTWTYAFGALQVAYGIIGMALQWIDSAQAMTLITSGLAIFGLTKQNVKLGRALGASAKI